MRDIFIKKMRSVVSPKDARLQVSQLKTFLKLNTELDTNKVFHYISDRRTKRIVLFHNDHELIRTLSKLPNTQVCYNVSLTSHIGARAWEIPKSLDYACPWNYEDGTQIVYENVCREIAEPLSYNNMYDYYLVYNKSAALEIILGTMNMLRDELGLSKDPTQLFIYNEKYQQAKSFIENGSLDIPYVESWASIKGYDTITAAKDIKINYELFQLKLSKMEHARLYFVDKVMRETDALNMNEILREFRMFNFGYMKL